MLDAKKQGLRKNENSKVFLLEKEEEAEAEEEEEEEEEKEMEEKRRKREFYCIFFINKSSRYPRDLAKLAASFSETFVNVRN
uniref:Uncharacterized protein n=1 Tax=Vespula pensylvanica TaxID=30213 RepID=A0A834UB34_VESPE|nr:hypothetical protein H0235_007034 [Vespula pensylvanica]